MKLNFKNHQIRRIALFIVAGHFVLFALQVPQVYLFGSQNVRDGFEWIMFARLAWGSLAGALLTPFILWAGYRLPIIRQHLFRNLSVHFLFGVAAGVIQHFVYNFGLITLNLTAPEIIYANILDLKIIFPFVPSTVVRYAVIIAIQQAYLYFRESQERAVLLKEAELEMLKMQFQPHFFFNTLNAIAGLNHHSPKEANRLIMRLGDMFRIALRKDKTQKVSLKEELEFLEAFFQIHQTLMGKRLQIVWRIEPETLDAAVPNLILQPLAENAVRHGLSPLEAGGLIEICAERRNGNLLLEVSDNGQGFGFENNCKNGGIGLSNVRSRLANLYDEAHSFLIEERAEGGVTVKIEIPFREQIVD